MIRAARREVDEHRLEADGGAGERRIGRKGERHVEHAARRIRRQREEEQRRDEQRPRVERQSGRLEADDGTSIVIVTRSCAIDERCLRWALGTPARYVGMLGSSRKVARVREHLVAEGVPEKSFSRLHAPVGLDLGARTHEEIAIAVVAELIAVRRTGASPRPAGPARDSAKSAGAKAGKA